MSDNEESGDKTHEPSQKRLDDARAQGDVPQSSDLTTAATYGGFLLACLLSGEQSLTRLAELGAHLLGEADRLSLLLRDNPTVPLAGMTGTVAAALAPFFLLPAMAAIVALIAQQAVTVAPEKLMPRLSRLSPWTGLTRKFGVDGLVEFGKNTIKLLIAAVVLGSFLALRLDDILQSSRLTPALATRLLLELSVAFLCLVLLEAAAIGALDLLWQRHSFRQRHRMSRQELLDELRQSEGDPHLKRERFSRGQQIAMNRMLLDVPKADVIIVNPTHYAVALVWKRGEHAAPVCVAKGVDEIATRIRARAAEAGVPVHRDPPTARSLHAMVEIGQQIRSEHYRAVAAAIRFAEAMRAKARSR